jgi:Protein of unknown function (DUF1573)
VGLTGTGSGSTVTVSTSSLDLNGSTGGQTVGTTSAPQTLTLTNNGTTPLAIASITASGDFAETNTCGSSLAPGASCTITVTFTPTAAGSRTGVVTITDNASSSPQIVALSGTGQDFTLGALTASQSVAPGGTAPAPHTPTGGTPAGASTLTITATSASLSHSTTVTLNVQ